MIRCFFISAMAHVSIIVLFAALAYIPAPMPIKPNIVRTHFNVVLPSAPPGGGGGATVAQAPPPASTPAAAKAAVSATPKPAPAPVATPKPEIKTAPKPTPAPEPKAEATPAPTPRKVVHKDEPEKKPKPEATPAKPEVKKKEPEQKQVVTKTKQKIVESLPTPTPKATPPPKKEAATPPPPRSEATPAPTPVQVARANPDNFKPTTSALPAATPSKTSSPAVDPALLGPPGEIRKHGLAIVGVAGAGGAAGGQTGPEASLQSTYFSLVLSKIDQNFTVPFTQPGLTCEVQFSIQRDGTITDIKLVKPTGRTSLDQYATQALVKTERVPPIYDGIRENVLTVIVTFDYERK